MVVMHHHDRWIQAQAQVNAGGIQAKYLLTNKKCLAQGTVTTDRDETKSGKRDNFENYNKKHCQRRNYRK